MTHAPLGEILKDADVMQHVLYNPLCDRKVQEEQRFGLLKRELGVED